MKAALHGVVVVVCEGVVEGTADLDVTVAQVGGVQEQIVTNAGSEQGKLAATSARNQFQVELPDLQNLALFGLE